MSGQPEQLLRVVDALVREAQHGSASSARLDDSLERDLGLDSLARVELLARIEQAFGVKLPEDVLADAQTPRDLLRAIAAAPVAVAQPSPPAIVSTTAQAAAGAPEQARTLIEMLDWHVQSQPDRTHVLFYRSADETQTYSYGALQRDAQAIAAGLRERDLPPGTAVAIMLPTGLEFFAAFYGVLLAGGVPVPLYPPARPSQLEDHLRRQCGILASCVAPMLITIERAKLFAHIAKAQVTTLHTVATLDELQGRAATLPSPQRGTDDIALLQYTSGSTGTPKGVVLTHANLLANIRAFSRAAAVSDRDVCVSWLPLYHDMGLIGTWLGSLYNACPLVLLSPLDFLARPERWLRAIHAHRGTISAAPNFAYELCARRIDDRELAGLDLGSWRVAFNGAEPVSPDTIAHFAERFARCGFRAEAMTPVYGLAECALALTMPPLERGPVIDRVQRDTFARHASALPARPDDAQALRFVACGHVLPGHCLRIVDELERELPERRIGRLQFSGPSASAGYFHNEAETAELIHGEWLESGDLAYLAGGDLYVTSRVKDMIIRGGRNLYPYELEEAIGDVPGIRKGCVAVFGSRAATAATERLVVIAETRERDAQALARIRREINGLAVTLLGSPPDDVVLAAPHSVLKTSSGKVRRSATRECYENGDLGATQRAPWLQMVRIALKSVRPQLRRAVHACTSLLYAGYTWTMFAVLATPSWLLLWCLPRPAWSWALLRRAMLALIRVTRTPFAVRGLQKLPATAPCVLVANHASYLDGLFLLAALPRSFAFVAKREFKRNPIVHPLLKRLGTHYVERFDVKESVADAHRLAAIAKRGVSFFFFPEGTFRRASGLRPFHLGAFLVAAEAGIPVLPVAIRGTRAMLPEHSWFPRRAEIAITIGDAIAPTADNWRGAVALRDAARAAILRNCGEPELSYSAT